MTSGVVEVTFQTIEPVAVVKLSSGFRCGIVTEVMRRVFSGTEHPGEFASLNSQFHCVQSQRLVRPYVIIVVHEDNLPSLWA